MAKRGCEWFNMSLDTMYKMWRANSPALVALPPEDTADMHAAFIAAIGIFVRGALHILQHENNPEDIAGWLRRAATESYVFSEALRGTGVGEFGLGAAAAEAARLLIEEERESDLRYIPNGEVRFIVDAQPLTPPAKADEETLRAFLAGRKPEGNA